MERVSLLGLDALAADIFVNLVTGAVLPDPGEVSTFGRDTSAIADSADSLTMLDRFGVVSDRVVLLDSMPARLNIRPLLGHALASCDSGRIVHAITDSSASIR